MSYKPINEMPKLSSIADLRSMVAEAKDFSIVFECGLKMFMTPKDKFKAASYYRDHETKYNWDEYENAEKMVKAIWGKIRRGGVIKSLRLDYTLYLK